MCDRTAAGAAAELFDERGGEGNEGRDRSRTIRAHHNRSDTRHRRPFDAILLMRVDERAHLNRRRLLRVFVCARARATVFNQPGS